MNIWKWLNGKKTTIAAVYNTAVPLIFQIWFADGVPDMVMKVHLTIGALFTVLGLGHKFVKSQIGVK